MKELSIKQKAERYDEISKEVKDFFDGKQKMYSDVEQTLNHLFPELKESEDERMWKLIKKYVHYNISDIALNADHITREQLESWLEKQGEKPQGKSALEAANEKKIDNQNCVNPTNNPEPEFREGEWVVHNYDICQIVKREEGCNKLVTVFGIEKELVNERNLSTAHLWTIQDAKDGDVLACGEEILLFKSYSVQDRISLYCWYNGQTNNFHNKEVVDILLTTRNKVCPATKEQRDLLFSKMKEAGYEWDAEKKKLKKIDDEEVNGEDYGIDGLWHAKRILEKTLGSVGGYQTDDGILDHKAAITAVKKLYEQKPTWTEEDEKRLNSCLIILQPKTLVGNTETMNTKWLKSLKERIGG